MKIRNVSQWMMVMTCAAMVLAGCGTEDMEAFDSENVDQTESELAIKSERHGEATQRGKRGGQRSSRMKMVTNSP